MISSLQHLKRNVHLKSNSALVRKQNLLHSLGEFRTPLISILFLVILTDVQSESSKVLLDRCGTLCIACLNLWSEILSERDERNTSVLYVPVMFECKMNIDSFSTLVHTVFAFREHLWKGLSFP